MNNYLNYIKSAGLDNNWVKVNPETGDYGLGYIYRDNPSSFPISPFGFRGKMFNDLVNLVTNNKYNLYGNDYAGTNGQDENWTTNKDCRKIAKKLSGLSKRKLKKLRAKFQETHYIPDDDHVWDFIDQFKKHTNAGHSLLADY